MKQALSFSLVLSLIVIWSALAYAQPYHHAVYYQDKVVILMYHDIRDEPGTTKSAIALSQFREQMNLLREFGFNVISMDEYADFKLRGESVPPNAVLITFDDGYESFYKLAYPILRQQSYPATNFVPVAFIDHKIGIPKLTWNQMREMLQGGMRFYSHSYDLHHYVPIDEAGKRTRPALTSPLAGERNADYEHRIREDLALAESRLASELGNRTSLLAFPYGSYNEQVVRIGESLGIELFFTIQEGINTRDNRLERRLNAAEVGLTPKQLISKMIDRSHR